MDSLPEPFPEPSVTLGALEEAIFSQFKGYLADFHKLKIYRDVKAEYNAFRRSPTDFSDSRREILLGNLSQARDAFWRVFESGAGHLALNSLYNSLAHGVHDLPAADSTTSSTAYSILRKNQLVKRYIPLIEKAIESVSLRN